VGSSGDDEDALLAEYANIALWVANKYARRRVLAAEWDDVHADALIGILDAIRHFDPARRLTQKAYVFVRAKGAAIDGIRQRNYVPRSGDHDRREPVSLDMLFEDVLERGKWEPIAAERGYDEVDAAETVPALLVQLSPRLRFVIEAYYFAGRSFADIAQELGVTESRVCQIRTLALRQMRAMLVE
jgi:RNA polymerase sigma factor (sigma-70 family)